MALLWMDGFDHYTNPQINKKWTSITSSTVAGGRFGGRAFSGGVQGYARKQLTSPAPSGSIAIAGFAVKPNTTSNYCSICSFHDANGVQFFFMLYPDFTLGVCVGSTLATPIGRTARALNQGVWAYVEIKVLISATVGTAEVRVNGEAWSPFPLTGQDTQASTSTGFDRFCIGNASTIAAQDVLYDDLYVLDGSGSMNNDFLGDCRVQAHYVDANGSSSQWSRSAGGDQYATIDEVEVDEADYNYTSVVGNKDTLSVENFKNPGGAIFGVQVNLWAKKSDAGTGSISPVVRTGGVDRDGTSQALSTDWLDITQIYEHDPATNVDWVEADFNSAEFGYKKRA